MAFSMIPFLYIFLFHYLYFAVNFVQYFIMFTYNEQIDIMNKSESKYIK